MLLCYSDLSFYLKYSCWILDFHVDRDTLTLHVKPKTWNSIFYKTDESNTWIRTPFRYKYTGSHRRSNVGEWHDKTRTIICLSPILVLKNNMSTYTIITKSLTNQGVEIYNTIYEIKNITFTWKP